MLVLCAESVYEVQINVAAATTTTAPNSLHEPNATPTLTPHVGRSLLRPWPTALHHWRILPTVDADVRQTQSTKPSSTGLLPASMQR